MNTPTDDSTSSGLTPFEADLFANDDDNPSLATFKSLFPDDSIWAPQTPQAENQDKDQFWF
eukprot:m.118467 g.118467  ORF g.118467 m.118467 type:complete len:61 (-) comp12893_c8_seq2:856-1038(-)